MLERKTPTGDAEFSSVSAGRDGWKSYDGPPDWDSGVMDGDDLAQLNDTQNRDRVLGGFNASTLDNVGPTEGDQGMKVLSEMNSFADDHEQWMRRELTRLLREKLRDNYGHRKQFSIFASDRIYTVMGEK